MIGKIMEKWSGDRMKYNNKNKYGASCIINNVDVEN